MASVCLKVTGEFLRNGEVLAGVPIYLEGLAEGQSVQSERRKDGKDTVFDRRTQENLYERNSPEQFIEAVEACSDGSDTGTIDLQLQNFVLIDQEILGIESPAMCLRITDMIERTKQAKAIDRRFPLAEKPRLRVEEESIGCVVYDEATQQSIGFDELIRNLEFLVQWSEDMIQLSHDREHAVIEYVNSLLQEGKLPIIVYGLGHQRRLEKGLRSIANVHSFVPSTAAEEGVDRQETLRNKYSSVLLALRHCMKQETSDLVE